jgi:hypothetical protein
MEDPALDMVSPTQLQELAAISAQYFRQVTEVLEKYLGQPEEAKQTKPDKSKTKTGYKLFLETETRELTTQANHPNCSLTDLSTIIGKKWANFPETEREIWNERARKLDVRSLAQSSLPCRGGSNSAHKVVPVQRGKVSLSELFDQSDSELPQKRRSDGEEKAVSKHGD